MTRYVVIGAGAIGGVVGGHLARAGFDVAFVARGEHGRRIAADGLTVRTPDGDFVVHAPVAATPAELDPPIGPDDVVLLCVKAQDTAGVLDALVAAGAAPDTPIACLQNGVENEPFVAERFERVYGVCVMAPTLHLEPGVVEAKSGPVAAILDVGRYPTGADEVATALVDAFVTAGMVGEARPDIMRWKWRKLMLNLGNAVQVVCGPEAAMSALTAAAVAEGEAVMAAAGIDVVTAEEDRARRGDILRSPLREGVGGSTWQSVARGGPVETDHLTGTIVRLGAQVGVPTPVNALLLRRALKVAAAGQGPGQADPDELLAEARAGA